MSQTCKWFHDFGVTSVINLIVPHGPTECACVEAKIPCVGVCFNKLHEESVLRTLEKYIMVSMSTSGHRLFEQEKDELIRAAHSDLFKVLTENFAEDQDYSDTEDLPGVVDNS